MSDGADVRDLIPDDPTIRLVHVAGAPEIGEKRNFSCNLAAGEICAHFDDDDYSAPRRLADQVGRLIESGKPVTGYFAMRFQDGADWWQYRCPTPGYSLGTALCFRRDWWKAHRFPAKQVEEDEDFVRAAQRAGAIVSVDAGELMYATIHAQNTSKRSCAGSFWRRIA